MTRPLRVLVLEDDRNDAELIEESLRRSGMSVRIVDVDSAQGFIAALGEFAPDVVISDHSLAQFNPLEALKILRAVRPTAPLIVVSGAIQEETAVACLRAGAEDIVLKHHLGRLRSVIEAALTIRRPLAKLSPRQVQVLQHVAEGLSTREIADKLRLSGKTVDTHRGALMARLGIHDVVGLVRYAVRIGLVPPEP
jgi:DNA-binding NarL/FixJ family response regulator